MVNFKKYLSNNKRKYNISEDALLNDDDASPVGDVTAPSSTPAPDLGVQVKPSGALSDNEVLGNCDHIGDGTHRDGFFKDGCFHIPFGVPLYGRLPKKKTKKLDYSNESIDVTQEELDNIKSQRVVFATQIDEFNNFALGDIVRTPWKMEYKVVDKKDITDITEHPFYDELTSSQIGDATNYANGKLAILKLRKI